MSRQIDAGSVFAWLTVIHRAPDHITPAGKSHRAYYCRCRCGVEKTVLGAALRSGATKSCGCFSRSSSAARTRHGFGVRKNRTGTYNSWAQMRHRCNNMDAVGYQHYGGRGIKVCERWNSFEKFLADMGERPAGHSIDRIDVNGNYEPDNCRWATAEAQRNNTRRSIFLTHNGETKTVRQWADALGMPYGKLRSRIKRGWTTERALS